MRDSNNYYVKKIGKFFPKPIIVVGYVGMAFSIYEIFDSFLIGLSLFIVCTFICFNFVMLEIKDNKYRKFFYFLFFKIGKWKYIEGEPRLRLVKKKYVKEKTGVTTNSSTNQGKSFYEIRLISDINKTKDTLVKFKNKTNALFVIKEISEYLDLSIDKR